MLRITVVGPASIFLFINTGTDALKFELGINGLGNGGSSGAAEALNPTLAESFLGSEGFLAICSTHNRSLFSVL